MFLSRGTEVFLDLNGISWIMKLLYSVVVFFELKLLTFVFC